jgi:hypothetical protein
MFGFSALDLSVGGRHGLWRNLSFSQGFWPRLLAKAFGQGFWPRLRAKS